MENTIVSFITEYSYIAVCLLILIENVFPPIPSEIILVFGGALAAEAGHSLVLTIAFASIGSLLGAIVLYGAGRWFGKERVFKILKGKVGKLLFLKAEDVEKADAAFIKYQEKAVLICRCIPIVRSLISIPAGIEKMNMPKFLLFTTIGSTAWNTLLVCLGAFAKDAWHDMAEKFEYFSDIVLILLIVLVIGYLAFKIIKHFKSK